MRVRAYVIPRARIFGINDRVGGKRRRRVGNADDHRPVIVELDHFANPWLFTRPHELEARPVDDHRVGLFEVLDRAQHQARCDSGQCRVVDAEQDDLLQHSIARMRDGQPFEKGDGPIDPVDAPHPIELHVGHGLDLVDILDARIHNPDVGLAGIEDLTRSPQHQPDEDRDLVRHQHCREGDTEDQTDVFSLITEQDSERYTIHPSLRRRLRGGAARRRFSDGSSSPALPCSLGLDHP